MHLLRKQVVFVTAFLAVMFAQAYGLERGYASHHGISVIEREFDDGVPVEPGQALMKRSSGGNGVPENHAPMTVDMEAGRSGAAAEFAFEFALVQVAEISVRDWILSQLAVEAAVRQSASSCAPRDIPPPAAVQVARCVVMLI